MKKTFVMLTALICALMLCGCQCSHVWVEADCVTPKTCSECGETEGEALGHSWVEATCAAPKSCENCGETEGEALAHTWVDANFQAAKTCTVCAATEGEPLIADFESLGLAIDAEGTGVPCTLTIGAQEFTAQVDSWETLTAAEVADALRSYYSNVNDPGLETYLSNIQDVDGYEWKAAHILVDGSGVTSLNYVPLFPDYCDYYDLDGLVDSLEEGIDKPAQFTVNFNGQDYTECAFLNCYSMEHIDCELSLKIDQWMYFRLPVGYDGMVLSFGDATIIGSDYNANYMDYYYAENTVSFRMN